MERTITIILLLSFLHHTGSITVSNPDWEVSRTHKSVAVKDIKKKVKTTTWSPDPKDLVGPYEEVALPRNTNAYFMTRNNTEVTVQVGSTVSLSCQVFDVEEHETVSWIRRRDHHIISVSSNIYSNDARFQVTYSEKMQDWTLHIRYAQALDSGVYECQLNDHPPMSIYSTVNVIEAISEISGGTARHFQVGSSVHLSCTIKNLQEPPTYVFWYHGSEMINYDTRRRVIVNMEDGRSDLMINHVTPSDSGNYTCAPSNARKSSFPLHVITGEVPAAMQGASGTGNQQSLGVFVLTLTISFLYS